MRLNACLKVIIEQVDNCLRCYVELLARDGPLRAAT